MNRRLAFKLTISVLVVSIACVVSASATCYECQAVKASKLQKSGLNDASVAAVSAMDGQITDVPIHQFNSQCFSSCIRETWPYMPDYVKFICGEGCDSCMSGNLWACAGCYGCTLGYAFGCANECL